MGALADAARRICDDCNEERPALDWWGRHIRICPACRAIRDAALPFPNSVRPEGGSRTRSRSQPCADAGTHIPRPPEVQQALNQCWRAVDALGGTYDPNDDRACGFDDALRLATAEIEKLGGVWS